MPDDRSLVAQCDWDARYEGLVLAAAPVDDPIRAWLESWIPAVEQGTCIELGCFPGRYLAVLGSLGYEVSGIDLTPRVDVELRAWLESQGCRSGRLWRADVLDGVPGEYDVVCSFGLIEHFQDWRELIAVHAKAVRPGGLLVLSTPSFSRGLQGLLHRLVDRDNLSEHRTDAMDPDAWEGCLSPLGFEILYSGPVGTFAFWVGPRAGVAGKALERGLGWAGGCLRPLGTRSWLSPFMGLIARRPDAADGRGGGSQPAGMGSG